MITPASFRADLTAFQDTTAFPDAMVAFWIAIAGLFLTSARWGAASTQATSPPTTILDFVTELFVAHNLALERQSDKAASTGGVPGVSRGPVASMSVGGVSIFYDTASGLDEDAGQWNLTVYGTRFIRIARMFGMGPVQIGIGLTPPGAGGFVPGGGAWPGPWPYPEQGDTGFV